jgi:hypothetical protein
MTLRSIALQHNLQKNVLCFKSSASHDLAKKGMYHLQVIYLLMDTRQTYISVVVEGQRTNCSHHSLPKIQDTSNYTGYVASLLADCLRGGRKTATVYVQVLH